MLIVGSYAMLLRGFGTSHNDIDLVCYRRQLEEVKALYGFNSEVRNDDYIYAFKVNNGLGETVIECLLADDNEALQAYLDYENANDDHLHLASVETLYSIKKGHVNFPSRNFEKHIRDFNLLHDLMGGVDKLPEITKLQFAATEKRYGELKTPSLNKTVKEFFGQSEGFVKSWFVHDDIHVAMAHKERPLYEYMQRDKTMAKCEKDLWEQFTHEEKMQCVLEEAYVIALERKIIPFVFGNGKYYSAEDALKWAMMRIATTLTGGWFRKFSTENYSKILETANLNYDKLFLSKVSKGEVRFLNEDVQQM